MVSKNNIKLKDRYATKQVPHYGIRKLSVGVASVLLSTTLYMGVTAHADTIAETNPQPSVDQPAGTTTGNVTGNVQLKSTVNQSASTTTNSISQKNDGSAKAVQTVSPEQSADTTDVQSASGQSESVAANSNVPENDGSAASASTALPKQPVNADTPSTATMSGVQPFVNLAVESDNNDLTPKHETIDSKWTLHYVNQADHKQELKDPTVITMQYTRTDTPQSDGTTKYGDWSYVPGSFKQTGTPITVKDSNNPVKQDNVDKNGENFDVFTITAMYPTVAGYGFYNGINGTRLHDDLVNDNRQADTMSKDFYAEYDVAKPTQETVDSQWTIHYVNSADHQQELKAPTVITMQYTRTNTPQSDGTVQYGDWSYVPGSFKQTGTLVEVNGSDNPVKEDNVNNNGKNEDVFSIIVKHPNITGYDFHNGTNGVRLSDHLLNNESNDEIQAPTMSKDGYVEYDVAKERSVAVKFVDDESFDPDSSDGKTQVGQALTLTGRDGDTVKVNVTVPDKYQLSNGQQLPTTYTFTAGSGDVTIHLVHKVVQREATINFQLVLMTFVDFGDNSYEPVVVTQARWKQLEEEAKDGDGPVSPDGVTPFTEVGTLTGHVGYDLVDEEAVSFGDDWTSLNLGSRTYQLPNGTDVVNGILDDSDDTTGEKLKEYYLNEYQMMNPNKPLDPDYVNRPWHGYLSVNATNNTQTPGSWDVIRSGLQAGLAGDESNMLAKATGDRAATAVKMANKTIDVNWLQDNLGFGARDFSEKDGRLQAQTSWKAFGVYIPYVEKTATRTIKVTTSDGKTTTVKQTATLAKQVEFGKDAHPAWTTGEWENYEVPAIPGYTASQTNVAKETVTGETEDQTVNITYTANSQTTTVIYQAEDGTPVHTTTVKGQTGQTVKVSNEVPVGWHVVNGTVPSEITFGPNGTPKTVVTIAHSHATVTPDAPKTTSDKLPDNPAKTYPGGVSHDDLNKTITRTIKVTTPDGQTKTIEQTSKLTRTADVDEVTGEVKYSDWTTGEWASYDVPNVPGYTASQSHVAQQAVTDATEDQTIEITYTANEHQISVEYVDNATGKILKTDHVSGKTGQTVSITPHVPDGWELVSDQSVSSKVTLGADGAPVTVIKVQPQERSIAVKFVDDQSDKRQVGQAITVTGRDGGTVDLNLTVPDKYQLANGQQLPTTYTFKKGSGDLTIHLVHQVVQREATVDVQLRVITTVDIDGYPVLAVTQTRWKQMDNKIKDSKDFNSDKVFPSVEVGTLTGHVGYDLVDNQVVSFNDDWTSLNLGGQTYQMPDGIEVVNGMVIDSASSWGKTLKEQYLKYYTDADPDYVNRTWHGYLSANETNEIAPNFFSDDLQAGLVGNEPNTMAKAIGDQAATAVKIANKTIDSNWLKGNFDTSEFSEQNGRLQASADLDVMGVYIPYVEKTATRTINVITPDGKTTTVKQTATLAKQVDSGKDAHPAWTTGEWASYDVPTIPGYTVSQSQVAKETVTGTTNDQTVNITYTANPQTTTVVYQTEDGTPVHTTTVNGHTGQTVKVPTEVPVGWRIVNGKVPSEITFGADGHEPIEVTVAHQHVTVTSDHPQTNGIKLPDNPVKTFNGVETSDLNKTITRTIKVTTPDGKTKTVSQTAKLTRTADVDEVTGEVTYSKWTTSDWNTYEVPALNGYTASQTSVEATPVDENTKDQTVEVNYTPNKQTTTIEYVDDKGQTIHTTTVNGVTNQTVKVPSEVPAGWMVTKGKVPSEITFGADGHEPIEVTVVHRHVTVDPNHPQNNGTKLPDNPAKTFEGVEANDLNKTITRTIKVTTPDGKVTTTKQTAKLTQTADVDEVTGEVTYSKWTTGEWNMYEVPVLNGYTASQTSVEAAPVDENTKDQTVEVSYTPNKQSTTIKYVDDKGDVVHTTIVTGVTDQTVKVPDEVPAGWTITKGKVPSEITFGAGGHEPVAITVAHQHVTVDPDHPQTNGTKLPDNPAKTFNGVEANDLNKTITRTIKVTTPDGKVTTTKQAAKLTRMADVDEVTGEVTYGKWTTGEWAAYDAPSVAGYAPSQITVAKESVTAASKDTTTMITYAPTQHQISVEYVDDDDRGKVVKTDQVPGKTDQTITVTPSVPTNYDLVDSNNRTYTVTSADGQRVQIHVKHHQVTTNESKTVTRTIKVHTLHDGVKTVKQTATLNRDVTTDQVTGEKTYGNWTTGQWKAYTPEAIPGYTPSINEVSNTNVDGSSNDQTVDVTYTADAQKLSVKFIDDTTGQVLKTVAKAGVTNAAAGYNTQSDIQSYEGQHYVLVSDSSHGANLVFDNNDSTDQAYEVHLKHGTHQIDEHHTITQTVHYIVTDHASVPDDHTASVQFDRDGYHDEVTGDDHWNAWKQGDTQTFAEVPTPNKAGYTPDKPSVPATVVHPSDHNQTVDVTYTPDTQKVVVTFIDDTDNGKTLKTVTKTGPTNSGAGYTTGSDINTYKVQHYVLVSDQTHGQNITFDTNTNADQRYEVHLKHGTHQINDHRTITETVHYKMTDGTTAPADHTAKAEFSRDGFNDEVTGVDHWNAWTPSATHQFDAVQSPAVKGYTPDADQITAVTVNPDSQNVDRTVTYTPDAQKLDVAFIDDTAGTTLKTVVKNGVTHADAKYNTQADIRSYERQHYVLVSDSSKGAELVFDNDDAVDQHYVVHLKHNTHAINEHHTVNETVHYEMSDGTKAPADYHAQALSFSRDGFNDEVTGADHWNAWTPKAEQTFDKVVSPLVAGYTPDIAQIDAQTVKPADHDLAFTVTYAPNVQIAHVKYIDDTDHKVLTQDDLNGRTGETSGYHTTDRITEFKRQHYVFVSDNYPTDGMTFDNHDRIDQTYEVHFKHGTRTDEQDVQVPRTIKYVYQDGRPAQPDHADALSFHETKVVDLVDGHTVSDDWTPAQDFKTIETPTIQGYTPDHSSVSNTGIAYDHSAIVETVTYNPDAQKAVVKYIDDTTGEQLEAKDLTGVSDQSTGYTTKSTIDGYVNQHYVLVSDDTDGKTVVFDHDDDADQAYEVHLKHGTEPANESRIKKIAVHYQYADGLARSGKAADDQTATNLTFKRTGTHDLVTDKIAWNAWDHADQTFTAIDSPAIQGYTPDRTVVDNVKVNPDSHDLTEVTVTYNADSQKLSVDFIDDTTGKTLKTVNKIGYSDESTDYNTKSDIQDFISKHYDLTSDQTNGENLVFDHDDNINQHYEVHLSHHTHQINEQHTVTETIHYQYADGLARSGKAADDFNATPLSFSRDGFNDEVTGINHWNAWTPADQQSFAAVQSPVIEGYTPDQSEIGVINVVPTSQSIDKTVTYTADAQKLTVNFIDDVTGQTLKTVAKTGYSDESVGYNTKADIQIFVGQHYDLVSDATKGAELVFDHDDGADQVYNVHLNHHLTPISDHRVVNETIHYVYVDGLARTGKADDDYAAEPFEFNRTGKHDDVTGTDAWNAWIPGSASFAIVQSPAIQGYTPDQSQIDVIPVDANSQDIVKTVTYSADQQKISIDFIDDTDHGKVLKTVIKTGGSDEVVGYNTKADIQIFVDSHYKLDHDTSNGENLVFDHDDAVDQHYEIHLTHATTPITEATSTAQVIHYQLADGTPVAKDYTAKVDFSRDGFKDLVTNADHWNAWTPNAAQTFDVVKSPVKAGYTPDHAQVDAVTVEPHHADLETTVTYSPDAQKAVVKYIDDVTGKTLQTKELTGVSDETSTYTTESTIKQYVGQHYKLVSDQTNGKPVAFDHDDGSDQVFEVHLTHTYQQVSQEHQVHQTIHYQYADGKQARPDYTAKALAFSRTGTQDLVTKNIQWNAWTPDQTFVAVDTPAINGYTPDVQTVAPVKVSHDSKDIVQTVVYHADDQTILVNYIDDETHSTLKTDSIIGKTSQTSDYTTKKSIDQYKGQHYDVVSDDTNGGTLTFDSDSTKVQTYNVHLKHQHQAASDKSTVHQTVHYVYQDGKQAAKDHTAAPIEFTRTGDTDLVTGKTTWNAWTPATGTFVAVLSPAIAGYTPSRAMINHVDVHPGDKDLDTTVTYVPDQQVIVVNYIDQTTGKTLKTDTLNGRSDQTSSYATKSQINSYLGQHYKLISDDTNGQTLTFDHDDQATQTYDVVLGHQTEAAHRTHEVRETVDYAYADGSQAAKSFAAQPLVFSQTGVHDLVTNTTDWNGEWTKPQVFAAVESPKIIGFTANKPEVKAVEVNHQSSDVHELVIYAANAQTAQIKYIDDVTGKTLETDGANGHFGESIVFGHNVNDQINKFKQAHYKLVSNNFAGQKYQADNTKNVYEVHLIHERQNVHATDSVTETVKFQYADGLQAQPTKTQTVNFGRDGIKDLVTGTTAWMPVDPQTIGAVNVPAIDGYTADTDQVPAVKVNFDDNDIEKVVTYTANDQTAGIKIIDDATGKVLNTQSATGKFGTEIQFKQNPDQQVIDLQAQHYELVSDNFNHQKYQADNAKNQFEIHVKHQMMDVQRTDKVTETVRYQDNHGNMLHPVTTQTKMFTEHGITDKVTGKTVWTPSKSQTMDAVSVPEITGYTPDKHSVPAATVNFGDKDINEVIVYTPVSETANIKYIDDTTGKTLLSDQVTGDFGSQIKFDHDPLAQINQYEGQGYELVSNSYGKTVHQFSATSGENNFEVHFKHGTMPVIDTDTVTETIHYLGPDGNKLAPDNTQTITFTRHGIKDQVTGQIDWNSVEPQEFNAVKSPVINGYQADIAVVEGRQVLFGDQDVVVNVHYTKLPEQQPGKQLGTDMVNTGKVTPKKVVTVANGTVQETKQDAIKNSGQSTMQDTKQLPQTGNDNRAGLLSLIGSSLMASLAIFGLSKKKKHEN